MPFDILRTYTDKMAGTAALTSEMLGIEDAHRDATGPVPGFSPDFRGWLESHGYGDLEFLRADRPSFGGRVRPNEPIHNEPVIFIHGNTGSAEDWREARDAFVARGYRPAELYALTYDTSGADRKGSMTRYHSRRLLEQVRGFIQAVKEYTGAEKVDVIAHSLGVTLARGAIKGGPQSDLLETGRYDLGPSIGRDVDTFVGIAGANKGLTSCIPSSTTLPVCGLSNGLSPSSAYLARLNANPAREADHRVYTMWSTDDNVIGQEAKYTSPIPGEDASVPFRGYDHYGLIRGTGPTMVRLVRDHDPATPRAEASESD